MGKTVLYDRNPPVVCLDKAGLLDLIAFKVPQLLAQRQQAPTPPAAPVWRPSLADMEAERAALVRARTTPGQIVAEQNAAYFAAQREQAEQAAQAEKGT